MALSDYIIRQFANGKLTHNSMSLALVTAGVKQKAERLSIVHPAPVDTDLLRKPYLGKKKGVTAETVRALEVRKYHNA